MIINHGLSEVCEKCDGRRSYCCKGSRAYGMELGCSNNIVVEGDSWSVISTICEQSCLTQGPFQLSFSVFGTRRPDLKGIPFTLSGYQTMAQVIVLPRNLFLGNYILCSDWISNEEIWHNYSMRIDSSNLDISYMNFNIEF